MGIINILSETLSDKIAAGEVVERPASVVKELLENSLDAGSDNIKIIIKEFGIEEIRIIDNGEGIANDDIEKAFMRHATSKIKSDYDLFHIETLGFRGEALASIASVSNIEIKSCSGEKQGKLLEISGGKIKNNTYYAPIKGTDISIRNLFFNTPARLKYLKNKYTEQAAITTIVQKIALSNPNVSFELLMDDKIILKTYGDGDIRKLISKVYNFSIAKNMMELIKENDDYKVSAFISNPEETRSNKSYINIFINGRYIKNYSIQNAVIDAYGTLLMKNRYPIVILNIGMNPVLLDVNVHPTKQEVRLSKESELIEIIKSGIQERLSNATYIPDGINNVIRKKEKQAEQLDFTDYLDSHFVVKTEKNDINSEEISDLSNINTINEADNFNYVFDINDEVVFFDSNSESMIEEVDNNFSEKKLPQIKVITQLFKTYILGETGDELYLIDQHAAQERYNFEKFQKLFSEQKYAAKQLLIPIVFNFSPNEMSNIKDILYRLTELQIDLQEFGNNAYILRYYPIWIQEDIEGTVREIIEKIVKNKSITFKDLRHDAIAMASCKASIKANQVLSIDEMRKVVDDLYSCENPFTCPHGRPIISKLSKTDLEKMFKRIV
ncbi:MULTISPECIES: DNA mismatch repair endonuclease MutL [unclassified Gemella]|uniref:DNA mismatch repair endonuclease MutL n=1 Tax=unclassified Gemella TaxID=2624949 RepID=UPI0015D0CDF6|nr:MULTISPECIES: DNA mismatch repair endonuclease MutL [unclassified Gemella]MBF0710102.1 DNA mismatch repair endonuclease MutL [Gemella sp. GL1.1]NYS27446.1 DNA mismatch repair endonuclease MutL [Gemella sp. GL1]